MNKSTEPNQTLAAYKGAALSAIELKQTDVVDSAVTWLFGKSEQAGTRAALYEIAQKCCDAQMLDTADKLYRYIMNKWSDSNSILNARIGFIRIDFAKGNLADANDALDKLITDYKDNPWLPWAIHTFTEYYYNKRIKSDNQPDSSAGSSFGMTQRKVFNEHSERDINIRNSQIICLKIIGAIEANSVKVNYALTAEFYHYAGTTSREIGEYDRAIKYYRVVVDKYPKYQQAWTAQDNISRLYERMQREGLISIEQAYDLVINAYQDVLDKFSDSPAVKTAQSSIERYKNSFEARLEGELSRKMKSLPLTK